MTQLTAQLISALLAIYCKICFDKVEEFDSLGLARFVKWFASRIIGVRIFVANSRKERRAWLE
jgi:hypothetical protein